MSLTTKIRFWVLAALGLGLFLYLFSSVLLPFVAGMALAYLLDPVADRLERLGLSRTLATLVILILFIVTMILLVIIVVPLLGTQLSGFAQRLPDYMNRLQLLVTNFAGSDAFLALDISPESLRGSLSSIASQGASWLGSIMTSLISGGQALMSIVSLLVVTPVVAFYLLLDWDHMVQRVDDWLPRDHQPVIRQLASEMNRSVSNFVRGQVTVSILIGLFYAIGLTLVGLNFGFLIGSFAGLISFIPYIGSIVGGLLALGVALVQFWPDWTMVAVVAAIFGAGQFIEGNILQPKLVGQSVGLHPVWLMFALFAFGSLFGFVGMLIAVPSAAAIGVLVRFGLEQYMASAFYRGHGDDLPALPGKEHEGSP